MGEKTVTAAPAVSPALARPSWVRYQVLAAGCSVAVITYIHRVGFAKALPDIRASLHLGEQEAGYVMAAFAVAYALFEIPAGLLGDRLGVRSLLTVLVFGWSLVTGCAALAVHLPVDTVLPFLFLLLLRFLFGMFQAGAFPSLSRMMTDWMPMRTRASAQGLIWMSTRLGGMLIPLVMGVLFWLCGNWQTPLWLVAGLGLVWCAAFFPWFRNRPSEKPGVNEAERALILAGRSGKLAGHGHVPWGRILRCRSIWALCLMYGCGGFAANFYVTLLPNYLHSQRHLPGWQTDLFTSAPFACGVVACLVGGLVSDWIIRRTGNRKWGRRFSGAIGTAVGSVGWFCIPLAHDPWALAAVLCLVFFCNDLSMGPAWAACADIGEGYAGTIGGAMNMVGNLAGAGGNILAGHLFDAGHPGWLFVIDGFSFAVACLCWFAVDVTKGIGEKT